MATSCILDAVNSILTQIGSIPFEWSAVPGAEKSRPTLLFQLVRMWNNQIKRAEDGLGYSFEKPACFIELRQGETEQLLDNVTITDLTWRLHIVDFELDAGDETNMDQNLTVFAFRDLVVQYMNEFTPTNCSTTFKVAEEQDYDHTELYHYTVDMKCLLTDTKGSWLDPDQVQVEFTGPNTNAEVDLSFTDNDTPYLDLEVIPT